MYLPPFVLRGEATVEDLRLRTACARLRHVYEVIALAVTAHKDGTLLLRWSCGEQTLPVVTEFESPLLRRIFVPEGE